MIKRMAKLAVVFSIVYFAYKLNKCSSKDKNYECE